jgi:hypothetical protein
MAVTAFQVFIKHTAVIARRKLKDAQMSSRAVLHVESELSAKIKLRYHMGKILRKLLYILTQTKGNAYFLLMLFP